MPDSKQKIDTLRIERLKDLTVKGQLHWQYLFGSTPTFSDELIPEADTAPKSYILYDDAYGFGQVVINPPLKSISEEFSEAKAYMMGEELQPHKADLLQLIDLIKQYFTDLSLGRLVSPYDRVKAQVAKVSEEYANQIQTLSGIIGRQQIQTDRTMGLMENLANIALNAQEATLPPLTSYSEHVPLTVDTLIMAMTLISAGATNPEDFDRRLLTQIVSEVKSTYNSPSHII